MKRISCFLVLSFTMIVFFACNDNEDTNAQWRLDNRAKYEAIQNDPAWKALNVEDIVGPEGVYYRDLTAKEVVVGEEYPMQTADVIVNYTGKYYNGEVFDSRTKATLRLNTMVRGFDIALQKMRTGEKWEICIPYYLGYGASSSKLQAYSTLFFEIELLKIEQYP